MDNQIIFAPEQLIIRRILKTHFQFPDSITILHEATNLCVGVGKCRRHEGGTMCPSYMVTREEKHSTRGQGTHAF